VGVSQELHLKVAGGRSELHDKDGRAGHFPLHLTEEGGHPEGGRKGGREGGRGE